MWKNDYQYEAYSKSFDVGDGDHRVQILAAKDVTSKTGKNMIEVRYKVENSNGVDFVDRIIEGEYFNKNMSRFFDVFGILKGDFNYQHWIGKVAVAHFEHKPETYTSNGEEKTVNKATLVYWNTHASAQVESKPMPVKEPETFPEDEEIF